MIKIENVVTPSNEQWKAIIMGMRNPMNSWDKYDSTVIDVPETNEIIEGVEVHHDAEYNQFLIGNNDFNLMKRLCNAGSTDRKFMRMVTVYADITAPLYWWKEFDTYKVGTVANSCSTMHKIHAKEFTFDDFSREHLMADASCVLGGIIEQLNIDRNMFLETKDKAYWWQMIQLLPSSYNQKRTVLVNYEVLNNMYKSRVNHKLDEWKEFCRWLQTLPYSELITQE